jgi:broad specificity phosphatase PhoE
MVRLFLIRHAEPLDVWGGGDADPGLSPLGQAQAEAAALALGPEGPLRILTSPMRRCRETASAYARVSGAVAEIEPRISEVASPAGVADRRGWLAENFPWMDARRDWSALDPALHRWRADALDAVRALESDAAIFSHFIAINAIVGAALGDARTIVCRPDFASITALDLRGGALRVLRLGAEISAGMVL